MKKLTPLFLSAAALVALSPEVANAQTGANLPDPTDKIDNSGDYLGPVENLPQSPKEDTSTEVIEETVEAVTTDDHIAEVKERREQDVTQAVLDESSIDVDQVYHTPVQVEGADASVRTEDTEKRYEYTPEGVRLTDRDKNEVQVNFTVNDQSRLVDRKGQAGERPFLGTGDAGKSNFELVNRSDAGTKTIQLSNYNGTDLFGPNGYRVEEIAKEDGTFDYNFKLAFQIPNNSISAVYDLFGTFIDENNNTIRSLITPINVVHQDDRVEIRDERTHPEVDAYQPDVDVEVPFKRVIKYVQHDEDVSVITRAGNGYEVGDIVIPGTDDDWEADQVTIYQLNLGERVIAQAGRNGLETIFYKQEFVDGTAVTEVIRDNFRTADRDEYEENTRPVVNEILLVGSVITNVDRVSGVDRFQNSVQLSREGWNQDNEDQLISEWGQYGSHVFIANADKYADSLTGTPLAAANGAPILLTRGNTLNGAVATELARLYELFGANSDELGQSQFGVTVLGGTNSISNDVATAITTALSGVEFEEEGNFSFEVGRIGGIDRYHQAFLVAEEIARINEEENEEGADTDAIYIASGDTFSDALAIAAQAGEYRNPVLLTRGNTLNEYARRFLETNISDASVADVHEANVTIVGGPSTISQTVATQINEILADKVAEGAKKDGVKLLAGGWVNREYYTNPLDYTPVAATVDRISGANRYEVSRNVNKDAQYTVNDLDTDFSDQEEENYTHYLVVSGDHPSDALPASALANQIGAGVLLVSNNTTRAQEQLLAAIENGVTDFTFIGGVNTLSNATFNIFNYSGDTLRAIINGPGNFSSVVIDEYLKNSEA